MVTINDSVFIIPSENSVNVNGETLWFDMNKPEKIKNISTELIEGIYWKQGGESKICYYGDKLYGEDYHELPLTVDESTWEEVIKPFTDQWQDEKDRIEHEEQEAQENYQKFSSRQLRAYDLVKTNYQSALDNAPVITSLGYSADISTNSVATLMGTKLNFENKRIEFSKGDSILIEPNEKYYYDTEYCVISMTCTPAWLPDQHKLID